MNTIVLMLRNLSALANARRVWRVLRARDRQIWLLIVSLGLCVAVLEAVTAGTALMLVRQMTVTGDDAVSALGVLTAVREQLVPDMHPLRFAALCFMGAFSLTATLTVLSLFAEGKLSTRIYLWAGVDLLQNYMRADYAWIQQQNSAEFTRNIQDSASNFAYSVVLPSSRIVRETAVFLAVSFTALAARPELAPMTLVLASLYAIVHWIPYRISGRLGRASESVKRAQQQALVETYDLFAEIRINGLHNLYLERFAAPRRAYRSIQLMRQLNELVPARAAEWLVLALVIGFIFALGPSLRAGPAGEYWMQTLIFALYLAVRLRATLTSLLSNIMMLSFGWASFLSVEKGLTETPVGYDERTGGTMKLDSTLTLSDVTFIYPNSDAGVRNIDIEIRQGQWIGIQGKSGSGKTTFAAIVMGLVTPQTGRILVDGKPSRLNQLAWYANIGFVSQTFALVDDSLRTNITLSSDKIDEQRLERAIKVARLERVIEDIPGGLDGRVGEDGSLLSGGQRQRVALARALYRDARLLILDEATSALDAATEEEILRDLQELRGKITLIAIAHRPAVVELCDCVYTIEEGRLTELDRHHRAGIPEPRNPEQV